MSYDFDQQPQGMSDGAKIALGCGAAAFLCMLLICGGAVLLGFRAVEVAQDVAQEAAKEFAKQQAERQQQADEFAGRFVEQGYHHIDAQMLDVTSAIQQPTVYTGQVINLHADSEASIAVSAQMADIQGTINGDLHVRCDVLNIHPDTVITGNLYLEDTHVFENKGTVQGEVIHESSASDETAESSDAAVPDVKPAPGDVIDRPGGDAPISTEAPTEPIDPESDSPATESNSEEEPSATEEDPAEAEDEPTPQSSN